MTPLISLIYALPFPSCNTFYLNLHFVVEGRIHPHQDFAPTNHAPFVGYMGTIHIYAPHCHAIAKSSQQVYNFHCSLLLPHKMNPSFTCRLLLIMIRHLHRWLRLHGALPPNDDAPSYLGCTKPSILPTLLITRIYFSPIRGCRFTSMAVNPMLMSPWLSFVEQRKINPKPMHLGGHLCPGYPDTSPPGAPRNIQVPSTSWHPPMFCNLCHTRANLKE